MRHDLLAVMLATVMMLAAGASPAQELKIGYVNSQEILASAPKAAEAQQAFEAELAGLEAEAQELQMQLQRMQQELQQQAPILSPEARQAREQEIGQKAQEAQSRMQELDRLAGRKRQQLIDPVMDEISDLIDEVRREKGYVYILDAASGAIVAADERLDLTDEIIQRLQSRADTTPTEGG